MIEMANEQDSLAGVHIDQGPIVANPKLEDVCSLVVRQKAKGILFFQHPQLLPNPLSDGTLQLVNESLDSRMQQNSECHRSGT